MCIDFRLFVFIPIDMRVEKPVAMVMGYKLPCVAIGCNVIGAVTAYACMYKCKKLREGKLTLCRWKYTQTDTLLSLILIKINR